MAQTGQGPLDAEGRELQKALTALLRRAAFRPTIPRLEILTALCGIAQPVQIQDLFQLLSAQGSAMNISTCYRCMAEFEKRGLVERDWLANGRVVYWLKRPDASRPAPYRMVCRACQRGFHVDAPLAEQLARAAHAHGLATSGEAMTILVQCACTQESEKNLKTENAPERHVAAAWPKRTMHRLVGRS